MPLTPGSRLGTYEIAEQIGSGGMGEVYRAHDTKLGRDVAVKVLPDLFANDPERLARFQREAELLASLNHPNIASIYGLEEAEGVRALVLELVEGPTLADVIQQSTGAGIPLADALPIASQIVDALEAAHERRIIHRDLKPANVKVKPDGIVKVLDFGLAKALDPASGSAAADPSQSPTLTAAATRMGVILGTAAYMSPEQAKGRVVDKQADIWAFGVVLYEMLTGKRAFDGADVSETLALVLMKEPEWPALPGSTPAPLRRLLRRCLAKDSKERLHDIADARLEIKEALTAPAEATIERAPIGRRAGWRESVPQVLAALLVGSLVTGLAVRSFTRPAPPRPARFVVTPPATEPFTTNPSGANLAISPDGRRIAYLTTVDGTGQLAVRAIDQLDARVIPGTDGAFEPFFSPDGSSVGFFTSLPRPSLRKVQLVDGVVRTVAEGVNALPVGGSWGPDDTIVIAIAGDDGGLYSVPAAGGEPRLLLAPDPDKGERQLRWPEILPRGEAIVFTILTGGAIDEARIEVLVPETGEQKLLVDGGSHAHYVPTGHLVYGQVGTLLAVPFDLDRLEVTGDPVPVQEDVMTKSGGAANFAVSGDGSLIYVPGSGTAAPEATLVWVDREGRATPVTEDRGRWVYPRVAPDGTRVAVTEGPAGSEDVWILDTERGTRTRLTVDEARDLIPVWAPDGTRVAFRSERGGGGNLYWKQADGSSEAQLLLTSDVLKSPTAWSPDGQVLLFYEVGGPRDIFTLPLDGDRTPSPWRVTTFDEHGATFSPDGRWIVYASDESGRDEVYVQPYPGPGERTTVSTTGGDEPVWSGDGREIFYRNGDEMMVVDVETQPTFTAGRPTVLFEGRYLPMPGNSGSRNYDVAPDGQRLVMVQGEESSTLSEFHVVLNWFEELTQLVPTP